MQHANHRAIAFWHALVIPTHTMRWRSDGQNLHPHVLTINGGIVENRRLACERCVDSLVAKWKRCAIRGEIAHSSLCIQDLDHDARVSIGVNNVQGKLTWPVGRDRR